MVEDAEMHYIFEGYGNWKVRRVLPVLCGPLLDEM